MTDTTELDFHEVINQKQWNEALDRIKEGKFNDISTVKNGFLPIHLACLRRNVPLSVIEALVDAEPDSLKVRSFTKDMALPIHFAAGCGAPLQVVQLLVKAFPDSLYAINVNGLLPLHSACWSPNACFDVVNFLIESFPDGLQAPTNTSANIPLHAAAYTDAPTEVIRLLIRSYSQGLFVANASGYTPRMVAEDRGHDHVAQLLYEEEAKIERIGLFDTSMKKVGRGLTRTRSKDDSIGTDLTMSTSMSLSDREFESKKNNLPFVPESETFHLTLDPDISVTREDGSVISLQDGIDSRGNNGNAFQSHRKNTNSLIESINCLSDAVPFVSPEQKKSLLFRRNRSISPLAGNPPIIITDRLVGTQVAQIKCASASTGESVCTFGDTESLGTANTGARTCISVRANTFIQELEQSEKFWGIQLNNSKARPSVIERICQLEERVFGKARDGPLLKRHRDLHYFGSNGESYAEWINQLEELFLGIAFTSEENNAVARIKWLETLFFGKVKTGDMRGRLKELDTISRFG